MTQKFQVDQGSSPRVRQLRREIVSALPRWPNNVTSKQFVSACPITDLMIYYLNWQSRHIPRRPRKIVIEPAVTYELRFSGHEVGLACLIAKAQKGLNLDPHISLLADRRGFAPETRVPGCPDKWLDKDFMLAALGWHHFHLGSFAEKRGHINRTSSVVFAEVRREEFTACAISDHSAFIMGSDERRRLFELRDFRRAQNSPPGSFFVSSSVMTSGHEMHVVSYAQHCLRTLFAVDDQIDARPFLVDFYEKAKRPVPTRPKLAWRFLGLDFGIHDSENRIFSPYCLGWM